MGITCSLVFQTSILWGFKSEKKKPGVAPRQLASTTSQEEPHCKELSLAEAERLCIANSFELQAGRFLEAAARADQYQTTGALLPQITYGGNCLGQRPQIGMPAGGVSITQPLLCSPLLVQRALKSVALLTASLERIALENQLILSVRETYYSCVLAKVQRRVHRDLVEILQGALRKEQQRRSVGRSTQFEVDRAKVALASSLSAYFAICQNEKVNLDQLSSLISWDPQRVESLKIRESEISVASIDLLQQQLEEFEVLFPPNEHLDAPLVHMRQLEQQWQFAQELVETFEELAQRYQPELRINRLKAVSSQLKVKMYRANYLPNVSASYSSSQDEPRSAPWQGKQRWTGAINFSWTVFDGFAREQGVRGAKLRWRAQRNQFVKMRNDLSLKLREQFHRIEEGLLAHFVAKIGEGLAQEALDQAQVRQDLGQITPLDYRITANQLFKARLARVEAAFGAVTAYYKLRALCAEDYRNRLDELGDAQWSHE